VPTIDAVCHRIALERQAQQHAEKTADADAWCGAAEQIDVLLDDLCALLRQRDRITTGHAPSLA
jgi:hypothetical protein